MGKENIEKYSGLYALLKLIFQFWHNNVFYRRVIVLGRDNISYESPNIFAPNHQNALMDALAVLFTHKGQPIFLARADIYKKKIIASLLYFFKILPVYRIRDGYRSLKGNDEIFSKTIDVLRNRNGLVILPEGSHDGFRRLRQLKKGICRIAFQAEEASDFNLDIKIIPVGLEFSHYSRYRQVLTVVYGRPIDVLEYKDIYRNTPEIALNELRNRLSSEMKLIMVHIDSEEDYEAIDELRNIINGRYSDNVRFPKLFRDRMLIEKLNRLKINDLALYKRICSLSLLVKEKARELRADYRLLAKKKHPIGWLIAGMLGLIATLPVFIYGNIFNFTFLEIPNLNSKRIKDTQFRSTAKYAISLAMAFILLPALFIISFFIFSPWWLAILIFISLPLSGLLAWDYYLIFHRIMGGFRVIRYMRSNYREYMDLRKNHDELLKLVADL
ncbi:MAG: 1-acyl-sn-glycerol-3-phosphate acyltransferase [Bacteroidales bacterium]|jgi:1-acyl-sn-glycerol-3-phosphate acyltransferase